MMTVKKIKDNKILNKTCTTPTSETSVLIKYPDVTIVSNLFILLPHCAHGKINRDFFLNE